MYFKALHLYLLLDIKMPQLLIANIQGGSMSTSKSKAKTTPKKESNEEVSIENLKESIIEECKKLATFKTSSAFKINELTKELLRREQGVV